MTEQEWISCTDPYQMLTFVDGKTTSRKLRLLACAYCRRAWDLIPEGGCRKAVEVVERYVDSQATEADLRVAASAALRSYGNITVLSDTDHASAQMAAATVAIGDISRLPLEAVACGIAANTKVETILSGQVNHASQYSALSELFRDIFGNPFRHVALATSWLAWNDGMLVKLAQAIYEERDFDRISKILDTLERAGCTDIDILNHCRKTQPHVLGCWVIDLILGKS